MTNIVLADKALRPRTFDDFIGQTKLKERLAVHIEAARVQRKPLPHVLLNARPGMGKTTIAGIIQEQLSDPMAIIAKPCDGREIVNRLWEIGGAGVILIDEFHDWTFRQQGLLLTLMEDGYIDTRVGPQEFPWLTVIIGTTERQKILPTIVERCPIAPAFVDYTDVEMAQIVLGMAERADIEMDFDTAEALGKATAGVPRVARGFVLAAADIAIASGTMPSAKEVLEFCEVTDDGLTVDHLDYLRTLVTLGGTAGMENLATQLRLHPSRLKDLERLLVSRRLVVRDNRGRIISGEGRARVNGTRYRSVFTAETVRSR